MGTPVYVTLLVAAIAGVVALSVGWFARITARDIAALTANQKRQDVGRDSLSWPQEDGLRWLHLRGGGVSF